MSKRTLKNFQNLTQHSCCSMLTLEKKLKSRRGNGYRFVQKGGTFPTLTMKLVARSSGLWEAYTPTCPQWDNIFTTACWCRSMMACQVAWISDDFWFTRILKPCISILAAEWRWQRCLTFIPVSCMGPKVATKDTHLIFQPVYMHWSMCM